MAKAKAALLIGINYRGTTSELRGCINDVTHVKKFLLKNGYRQQDITVLTDDTLVKPTLENMTRAILKLVKTPAEQLFFHYSGHGGSVVDRTGDEADGRDETLVPLDYQTAGMLLDDQLRALLAFMSPKSRLTAVLDCCHSGSGMDLRYSYRQVQKWTRIKHKGRRFPIRKRVMTQKMVPDAHYRLQTPGQVVMLSGCLDPQYSADAFEESKFQGALSYCFLKIAKKKRQQGEPLLTWGVLIKEVRDLLKIRKYEQIANLSSGRPLNLAEKFAI